MDRTLMTIITLAVLYSLRDHLPLPFFHLPGDIEYHSLHIHLFLPLATCLLVSVAVSIIIALFSRQ